MKRIILALVAAIICLTGCDLGKQEREAAEKIYKANSVARKQCEAKLQGLKQVPIAGTGGKLFLDAEKLPMWRIGREFRVGDECGAGYLGESEIFYWDGYKIISRYDWIVRDKKSPWLIDKNWIILTADVYLGMPRTCKISPDHPSLRCNKLPPDKNKIGVIQLKNHPLEAWPFRDPKRGNELIFYSLALPDWPKENGWPRILGLSCNLRGMIADEVQNIDLNNMPGLCELDFYDFSFYAGTARINIGIRHANKMSIILQEFQKYLNAAISEEK